MAFALYRETLGKGCVSSSVGRQKSRYAAIRGVRATSTATDILGSWFKRPAHLFSPLHLEAFMSRAYVFTVHSYKDNLGLRVSKVNCCVCVYTGRPQKKRRFARN
jgi:hypothetical protein